MSPQFPAEEIEQSIAERFEKQAAAHPGRVAIRSAGLTMTYAELNAAANRLGRAVLRDGGEADRVVLLFEQGGPVLVGVLAVLKAGKTYVPLDPESPPARLAELLEDAQAGLILTNSRHRALAEQLASGPSLPVVAADDTDPATSGDDLGLSIAPDAIAYMLYTSGSTGRPKGVVQTHRNLLHFVRSYTNSLGITPQDRIGWLHSITFSASNMNVYPALLNGATLCPYDVRTRGVNHLAQVLLEERITICQCVPTVFRHFIASLGGTERFPDLRIWELGGEPVYRRDVELFRARFPAYALLINRLALTEASVAAQYVIAPEADLPGSAVPVGHAADGVEISLSDESGRPIPPGQVGEIIVKSHHLSPGYWRRPDLTAAAFHPDPEVPGRRMYRTGDLGRMQPGGLLEYFGRKDFRVKVRGYTIEVAEVETALLELGRFKHALVVAREDRRGDQRLVAYLVSGNGVVPTATELRARLTRRLPDYMVPTAFVMLDELPATSTGKLDRMALPAPDETTAESGASYAAPCTPLERLVADVWAEVFGLERVGVHDDFFALGGHSLLATQLVSRIWRAVGVELPMQAVFEAPTVAELAGKVALQSHTAGFRAHGARRGPTRSPMNPEEGDV
jgi:amino acid adenylation domain-containing protein